jgi:hypothetical protein
MCQQCLYFFKKKVMIPNKLLVVLGRGEQEL